MMHLPTMEMVKLDSRSSSSIGSEELN